MRKLVVVGAIVASLVIPASPAFAKSKPHPHNSTSRTHQAKRTYSTKRAVPTKHYVPRKTTKRTFVRQPQIQHQPHGTLKK